MTPELADAEIAQIVEIGSAAFLSAAGEVRPLAEVEWLKIRDAADQYGMRAALSEYHRILEERGYVVVPKEPTEAILAGMGNAFGLWVQEIGDDADVYRAMIEAAGFSEDKG